MKIGLYFGSFNPIHVGHLIIANHMVENTDLDQVWFVVSPHNPFKEKKTLLADHHRLALVKEAIDDNPKLRASDVEFHLEQPNYTVKTLMVLKENYPSHTFVLLMGEDNLASFHKWKNYEYILEHYQLFVYPRVHSEELTVAENNIATHPSVTLLKDVPIMNISSTFIRNGIKNGKDVRYLLTPPVAQYVDEMGFYK
ncbi:MAG TPA: nicotinate (nicotinamide) nucleotide adenylyltransferase [Taishania sp.]|nr:nicotinate (nicotinamide) nucleotide adenylyltransferase [Taishania sp.]